MGQKYYRAVITSSGRINPSDISGDFTFRFNNSIERVTQILVDKIEIPFTCYVINSNNNVLTFNGGTVVVTIPAGNYNVSSIISELDALLLAAFPLQNPTVDISDTTSKLSITMSASFTIDAYNPLAVTPSTASPLLGFSTSATGTTVTANNIINIYGTNYIILTSQYFADRLDKTILYPNNLYPNAIMSVPVDVNPGDLIFGTSDYPIRLSSTYNINNIDIIDIQLNDDSGNIIDLNGLDWSMHVVFVQE